MRRDADAIESFFDSEVEKLDSEFLEKIKNVKTQDEAKALEASYKQRASKLLEDYNREYTTYLEEEKRGSKGVDFTKKEKDIGVQNEDEDKDRLDMSKPFVAKGVNLKPTTKEIMQIRWDMFKFRLNVKVRNFDRNYLPSFVVIFFYKLKLASKRTKVSFLNKLSKLSAMTSEGIASAWNGTKELSKKIASSSKNFFLAIVGFIGKIFKRKKKEKKEDKEE